MKPFMLLITLAACGLPAEEKPIHPLVFEQVAGWISDTESPVTLQISLDAMRKNRNQFDYDGVSVRDGTVRWTDGTSSCGYRAVGLGGGVIRYEVWSNDGGTLTERHVIDATTTVRKVIIRGATKEIDVLEVIAFDPELPAAP
jgi:hypothetical protein